MFILLILKILGLSIVIAVIIGAIGYNLRLPGYSRKKMLEGQSVRSQMTARRRLGDKLFYFAKNSILTSIIAIVVISLLAVFINVKTVTKQPDKLDIIVVQGETIVVADKKVTVLNGARLNINKIYFSHKTNIYGLRCPGPYDKFVVEYKKKRE